MPKGDMVPFGFMTRKVDYTEKLGGFQKAGQRPLEEKSI